MNESSRAVFLSYASQDAEAAKRICEALRAAGVEVWFDQDELVGGDAWDAKIRGQIAACALFVPIISAATQARREGYFRLEWRLAAQRTHMMSETVAFLLPVVIDATRDAEADVPAEFKSVQWTRLRPALRDYGGQARGDGSIAAFCARVTKVLGASAMESARPRPVEPGSDFASASTNPEGAASFTKTGADRRVPVAVWGMVGVVVALAVGGYFWVQHRSESAAKSGAGARPLAAEAPAAPLSEARKLVAQARALFDDGDQSNHENFFLADDLLKRALSLDATDGEVWAAQAQLSGRVHFFGFDRTTARREAMRMQAERAVKLTPDSVEAQLAMAGYLTFGVGAETVSEAIQLLNQLVERAPQNRRIFWTLGCAHSIAGKIDDSAAAFRRGNLIPGGDPEGLALLTGQLFYHGRYAEVEEVVAQSLALRPVGRAQLMDVQAKLSWRGDLDGAAEALARWPAWLRLEDRGGFVASQLWMWRREPDKAIAALNALSRDFLNDSFFVGPKAGLLALAHELANRPQAARQEWENARQVSERVVAVEPSNKRAAAWKAIALARLGQQAEAGKLLGELEQLRELRSDFWSSSAHAALLRIALGRGREVPEKFDADFRNTSVKIPVSSPRAALRLNPVFDPIRETPEFRAWLAAAPAPAPSGTPAMQAGPAPEKSVAVLAFTNLSDDKANEYLSDGISEGLINVLGRVPGLTVRGRTSAFYFKGKTVSVEEIAQRLNVAHLVRGSVQKRGGRVRITAELTRAATDEVIWTSEPLDRDVKDIFAVQDEIAGLIAKNLELTLGRSAAPTRQVDPESHRLYLEGRHFWSQRTDEGFDRAERAFTQALLRDPTFARAQAGLADLWAIRAWYQGEDGVGDVATLLVQAEAAAKRALELDPGLVEVHATFGAVRLVAGRIDEAKAEFERCVALAPNYATARNWRGELLLLQGRIDRALDDFRAAAQLDPLSPIMVNDCVRVLLAMGRPAEALAYAERVAAFSESATGIIYRAHALQELGRCDEAAAAIRALAPNLESTDGFRRRSGRAVYVLRKCGHEAEAVALADSLMRRVPADSFVRGFILAALERFDEAIPLLAHMPLMTTRLVFWEPAFDRVRDDPRLHQVMVKLGCAAEYQVARETLRRLRSETEVRR